MTDDQNDEWPPESVSLCEQCAKHPELKALVESDPAEGVCGVCGSSAAKVFNPERFAEVRNLIRALIRLHFNEEDYNPHWGGTSIDNILLGEENPIVETAKPDGYPDEFIHRVTWEGDIYPDRDKSTFLNSSSRRYPHRYPRTFCWRGSSPAAPETGRKQSDFAGDSLARCCSSEHKLNSVKPLKV